MTSLLSKKQIYTVGGYMLSELFVVMIILFLFVGSTILVWQKNTEKYNRRKKWMEEHLRQLRKDNE